MSSNPSLNRLVRQTIYTLKGQFGNKVSVYKLTSASTDYRTGVKSSVKTSLDIQQCIVLPTQVGRTLNQTISYISGSKSFVSQGGQGWDQASRDFIIDARDVPKDYELEISDWIVYRSKRYDIKSIEELEFATGWLITATRVEGGVVEQIHNLNIVDNVPLSDGSTTS